MRRSIIVLLATGIAVSMAPAASAKSTCKAPGTPAWHSCLSERHVALADGNLLLRRATPALTIRMATACPSAQLAKRTVVLRTKKGKKLARARVKGTCHGNVARFHTTMRPNLEVKPGTVIRSYWSGIDDSHFAPKVTIGG